jgi:hypothetical protein
VASVCRTWLVASPNAAKNAATEEENRNSAVTSAGWRVVRKATILIGWSEPQGQWLVSSA